MKITLEDVENCSTEGERGVIDLCSLISKIGYNNLTEFLIDNSGAIESIHDFVIDFYVYRETE